jgi:hypothetical protein
MNESVSYLYQLLEKDGLLLLTAFNLGGYVKKPFKDIDNEFGFVTQLYKYFEEITPFMFRKRNDVTLGKMRRSRSRKRRNSKRFIK